MENMYLFFFIFCCSGLEGTDVNSGCVAQRVDGIEWIFSKPVLVHISYVKNISAGIQI